MDDATLGSGDLRRRQAFEDYWRMGDGRSVKALWERYVADNRAGKPVPTTNKTTIYRWKNDDGWDEQIAIRLAADLDRQRELIEEARDRAVARIALVAEEMIDVLREIAMRGDKDATRVAAATELLNRLGVVDQTRLLKLLKDEPASGKPGASPAPSTDTPEGRLAWLKAQADPRG